LATVTTASSLGQLGLGALAVVAAVIATSQARPAATGWLLTAVAVGGLVGSLWWTWRPAAVDRAPRVVMFALAGIGAPLAAAALSSSLVVTAALFTISGIFLGPFTGALFTTRENRAPADARAQVFTISAGLKTTAAAAGAALGGALAHLPVAAQLLLVAASPLLAAALGGLALARQLGQVESGPRVSIELPSDDATHRHGPASVAAPTRTAPPQDRWCRR
jgi:predicted MFS family arabinose efflux permease